MGLILFLFKPMLNAGKMTCSLVQYKNFFSLPLFPYFLLLLLPLVFAHFHSYNIMSVNSRTFYEEFKQIIAIQKMCWKFRCLCLSVYIYCRVFHRNRFSGDKNGRILQAHKLSMVLLLSTNNTMKIKTNKEKTQETKHETV